MRHNSDMYRGPRTKTQLGTWPSSRFAGIRYVRLLWLVSGADIECSQYADLSEYGYGVAILSESKYGFSCRGNILRISLLRAATAPDAEQDQGKPGKFVISNTIVTKNTTGMHEFAWAVMPHKGHFLESDVPQAAYLFNSPLHCQSRCSYIMF